MEYNEKLGKQKKTLIVVLIVLSAITIILTIVNKGIESDNKILKGEKYIIEKETECKDKGLLPSINLKGKEIENINETIVEKYYSIAYKEYDTFHYEYSIYKNILSLHIMVTYTDDSEYGKMENLTYNIDVKTNKILSNDELLAKLNLNKNTINNKIEDRLKIWYNNDLLKEQLSYAKYKERIGFDSNKNSMFMRNDKLYYYMDINVTYDILSYDGNIFEVELESLK